MPKQLHKPLVYYPQSVFVPQEGNYAEDTGHRQEHAIKPLNNKPVETGYDDNTIFYDMFFSQDLKYLFCLGPPLSRLKIGKLKETHSHKQKLPFKVIELRSSYHQLTLVRISLISIRWHSRLEITFVFNFITLTVPCSIRNFILKDKKQLTLATLQKNNPVTWLKDWSKWHNRLHGVERVVIYDNGSDYFSSLIAELGCLTAAMELLVIKWPFPYGSKHNHTRQYCQIGALNHFRLCFGASTEWCINLDIDEYLYNNNTELLARLLNSPQLAKVAVIYLYPYIIPAQGKENNDILVRFFDYNMRLPKMTTTRKYI